MREPILWVRNLGNSLVLQGKNVGMHKLLIDGAEILKYFIDVFHCPPLCSQNLKSFRFPEDVI